MTLCCVESPSIWTEQTWPDLAVSLSLTGNVDCSRYSTALSRGWSVHHILILAVRSDQCGDTLISDYRCDQRLSALISDYHSDQRLSSAGAYGALNLLNEIWSALISD